MAAYSIAYTYRSVTFTVTGLSAGNNVTFYHRKSSDSTATETPITATGSTLTHTIEGLDASTAYTVNVYISTGEWLGSKSFITNAKPTFTIDNVTSNSVTITVKGFVPNERVRFQVKQYSNSATAVDVDYFVNATTLTQTYGGLTPNTVYYADVQLNQSLWLGGSSITAGKKFTTLAANARPSNWSWTSTIASGYDVRITATEWNDFCTRINAFRTYQGLSVYGFTTVSKGTPISATIVNQARTAIDAMTGHGALPTMVYSGDPITASFFNTLRTALNTIP